jgi:5-methylcytosine-specific restriction enzyme A
MAREPRYLEKLRRVSREQVIAAIDKLDRGYNHAFGDSTKYDLVHSRRRYPSKAVLGVAAEPHFGRQLRTDDFSASDAFPILRMLGFQVVLKESLQRVDYPDEVGAASEGSKQTVTVNRYERDPTNREACLVHHGTRCIVCDFDFGLMYGAEAAGYIHVHHLRPLSEMGVEHLVDPIKDLVPMCPNCHAAVHLFKPLLSPQELRERMRHLKEQTAASPVLSSVAKS